MSVRNAISTKTAAAGSAVFAAAMGFAVMASPAMAQAQAPASGQAPQGWYKACTQQAENDVCVVQNIVAAGNGQLLTAVGLISVEGQVNQRVMQVSVPSARLVQPGINMQIDGGQATKLDFAVCMPDKCVAEVPLSDAVVAEFKRGREVVFTSVNFQRAPNPISISLSGFTQAFDGEAMAQSELEERQRVLQEEMQRKAAEARQRLEEAQEAAKSN
ncbi:invasion associated locus B family protein [Georhizobium profundi]|jgi:invasion protein IalB|uniref:Invasion associated locus B family protein n=2 Tax=Rhizobiaceae TaxID=82115 RepID=A0A3Q8XNR8_9HYPH|nr:invasion associated locus B family protein [Georhizobium profundi]